MFYTIKEDCSAEITEKKSKFICNVFHVESVEEVLGMKIEVEEDFQNHG